MSSGRFSPALRAAEKQHRRDKDEADLQAGRVGSDELQRRNNFLPGFRHPGGGGDQLEELRLNSVGGDMLPPDVVAEILDQLADEKDAFLVGGQALNLWAERYAPTMPEIVEFGPFMSKDVDFFGRKAAAKRLAKKLGGEMLTPDGDDHSPQSALVRANLLGRDIEIDFLWHVQGPPLKQVERQVVLLEAPLTVAGITRLVPIRVMHPLHCLESRAGNVITLQRETELAIRQLDASIHAVRGFIAEALANGQPKTASSVLKSLGEYLLTDPVGCMVHERSSVNPIEIIKAFRHDPRLDERYRGTQLESLLVRVHAKQRQRAANAARRAARAAKRIANRPPENLGIGSPSADPNSSR